MPTTRTEARHMSAKGLDAQGDEDILNRLLLGQQDALNQVGTALSEISAGAALMAQSIRNGHRLIYAAAGSSGLMALADSAELGGTFGIPKAQIRILMAGGVPVDAYMPGGTEDDVGAAHQASAIIAKGDTVIAITASGNTPYPVSIAQIAQGKGARVICIANNSDADIFDHADVAIRVQTPPEVIAGSTRLGAGTAQKATLNMLSTLMGIRLGHVHDGMMVNLVADNEKLRNRANDMICQVAGVGTSVATRCLDQSNGAVKVAIMLASGVATVQRAKSILQDSRGNLRASLELIQAEQELNI